MLSPLGTLALSSAHGLGRYLFQNKQSPTLGRFFRLGVVLQIKIKSTKCWTWPFFSTSSRIRRVVMFDERVFDEKSCIDEK